MLPCWASEDVRIREGLGEREEGLRDLGADEEAIVSTE